MYTGILLFQVEIFVYYIIFGIDIPGDFIRSAQEKSPVVFIIPEKHGQCQKLQQQKADESKISADEKEDVSHRNLKSEVRRRISYSRLRASVYRITNGNLS